MKIFTRNFLIISVLFLLSGSFLFSQPWMNGINPSDRHNFYQIQDAFQQYWIDKDHKVKGKGWKQFKRWEWFWEQRVAPDGEFPDPMILFNESRNRNRSDKKSSDDIIQANTWSFIGPSTSSGGYAGLGRLNCVRTDPGNSNILWVGSASGGLWKSTNLGQNWTSSTDDLPTLGVTDIVINPDNTNIMYLATGDGDHSDAYSVGVLKSTNGGISWNTTGLDWTLNQTRVISRLLIHPSNRNILYAAANTGIYKTTDAGNNWTQVRTGSFKDMEFKPGTPTTLYASGSTLYRTTNSGTDWEQLTNNFPTSGVNRIALAVTPDESDYVYALLSNTNSAFYGLYLSTDSGDDWSAQSNSPNTLGWQPNGSDTRGQGWYDLCIAVSETDADEVYTGGVNVWKSTNGGVDWEINTMWYQYGGIPNIHADQHDLHFVPGTNILFAGNDGGIYRTTNGGSSWSWLGSGLEITQFYRFSNSVTDHDLVIAGAQDNGSKLANGSSWEDVLGGDGMECLIDYTDENIMYGSLYYGDIRKSTNGGGSFTKITNPITETGAWITPYTLDPDDPEIIFAGYNNVWKSTNGGGTWSKISDFGDTRKLNIVNSAPSNSSYLYAGTGRRLHLSTDGGTSWTEKTMPFSSTMTSLAINQNDPMEIWATRSGFVGGSKVYHSSDGGSSWSNISGSLPNIPMNSVIYQNDSPNRLYVGTDIGVYYIDDNSSGWQSFNDGLPNVVVTELECVYCATKLRACTYGRGIWEADLLTSFYQPVLANPSDNSYGIADNVDLSWTAVNGADNYRLQISKSSDFSSIDFDINNISSTNYSVNGLQRYTEYYWRIQAYRDCSYSDWSEPWSFLTMIAIPDLSSPADEAAGVPISGDLQWASVDGADSYQIQLSSDENFSQLIIDVAGLTNTSRAYSNLENYSTYYWRVRAMDGGGPGDWSDVWEFETILAPPELNIPPEYDVGVPVIGHFQWFPVDGADTYRVQLSETSDFSELVIDEVGIMDTLLAYSGLKFNQIYFWRATASNADGTSDWSEVWSFLTILGTPQLIFPEFNAKGIPVVGNCTWTEVDGVTQYIIQISDTNDFSNLIVDQDGLGITNYDYEGLINSSRYYWRVKAEYEGGSGAWSDVFHFETKLVPPVLVAPANNSQRLDINGDLVWRPVDKATTYNVEFAYDPGFDDPILQYIDIDDTTFYYHGLFKNKRYYWRVQAVDVVSKGEWTEPWTFTTVFTRPILEAPANNSVRLPLSGYLSWVEFQGADRYHLQLASDAEFNSLIIDNENITILSKDYDELESGTTYYWRVKAYIGDEGTEWSDTWHFMTELGLPYLVYPENSSTNQPLTVDFVWRKITGAANYELQVSHDNEFNTTLHNEKDLVDTNKILNGFDYFTDYHWRVREKTNNSTGPWSDPWTFKTILEAPLLLAPLDKSDSVTLDVRFIWSIIEGADSYKLNVSKESSFTSLLIDEVITGDNLFDYSSLEENTLYYWRVMASNSLGDSEWSETGTFTTMEISSVDYEDSDMNRLKAYPNPFSDRTSILFSIPGSSEVSLDVYNLLGKKVDTIVNEQLEEGLHTYYWKAAGFNEGVYFVRLKVDGIERSLQLVLVK